MYSLRSFLLTLTHRLYAYWDEFLNAEWKDRKFKNEYQREMHTLHLFSLIGAFFLFVYGFAQIALGNTIVGLIEVCFGSILLINLGLFRLHRNLSIATTISLSLFLLLGILLLSHGGIYLTGYLWIHAFPPLALSLKPIRIGIWYVGGLFGVIILFLALSYAPFSVSPYSSAHLFHLGLSYIVITTISAYFSYALTSGEEQIIQINRELRQERDTLKMQKLATQLKADELNKYLMAVEHASEQMVITDNEGHILYANPKTHEITGYSREEILGTKAGKLWGDQMERPFYELFWQRIKKEKREFIGKITNRRKTGQQYIAEIRVTPILDSDRNIQFYIGIERDISKAVEIEHMKDEFISLVSHQLRTPLSAIRWFAQLLLKNNAENLTIEQHEFLTNIYESNLRMIDLVNNLLNISRIESGKIVVNVKAFSIQTLVSKILIDLTKSIEDKKHTLHVEINPDIPLIKTDPNLLSNIITNILTNSIKYTPENGIITIRIALEENEIACTISDTGFGIPLQEQQKMFEKFFRGENVVKVETDGNGLGMYLVKKFINELRGTIHFTSKVNEGTTFTFRIPVVIDSSEASL